MIRECHTCRHHEDGDLCAACCSIGFTRQVRVPLWGPEEEEEDTEMYNLTKVKRWIKRAPTLIYDAEQEIITNGHAAIRAKSEMKPALLEAFGHLKGGYKRPGGVSEQNHNLTFLMKKPPVNIRVKDSKLCANLRGKIIGRILYYPATRKKVVLCQKYIDLFKNIETCKFVVAEHVQKQQEPPIQIIHNDKVIGIVAQFKPGVGTEDEAILNAFEFKHSSRTTQGGPRCYGS